MGKQHKRQHGFTIIEVVLFLAISGALAVGILATSSVTINNQRYRDALNSLQSLLQQQYNETAHVLNSRDKSEACSVTGIESKENQTGEARGTSECLVMGRYITITNGQQITLSNVVGAQKPMAPGPVVEPANDLEALQSYNLFISPINSESNEVAWGGTVTVKDSSNQVVGSPFAILILRSPLTGSIKTFSFQAAENNTINASVLKDENMTEKKLCIDPTLFTISTQLGVVIRQGAAGSSAIEVLQDDGGC